ncbi:glycosyltransferase family 4 protein [Salinigranum halophilum]|uniref:glycosyltransferase family 4 protein n=1 Tax=Salinigranum halophilum TaxID=2565931 RepID=UPI0010A91C5D|nr:glycosyltransferase family 4 protein [Salinigranum halophilum]
MRVALVTPRYPPNVKGGGEISAQLLAEQLQRYGDPVEELVVFSFDGREETTVNGVSVRRLRDISTPVTELQNLLAFPALSGELASFDVVHAYNMELNPLVGYLSSVEEFVSVATLNSYHFFPKSVINVEPSLAERLYETLSYPTTGSVLRRLMRRIDAFVAISDALREVYHANGFERARIEHVPNMVDPSFEVPAVDDGHDWFRLLYVGALEQHKGVEYLVRSMTHLPDDVQLRVVGDGRQATELRQLATELGVDTRIEFTGNVPYETIPELYATADAFVHPGIWPEPFGRTILEALEAGLPVVCTDIGGPPETVPDEELRCAPGDPASLAAAVRRAMEKSEASVTAENHDYIQRNYAPSVVVSQLVTLYAELVERRDG